MIQAIVFDFGNVIGFFDHRPALRRLAEHGELSAEEIYAFLYGGTLEDDYESGRLSTAEFLKLIRAKARLRCSDETVLAICGDIFRPNPEVCDLVPLLKPRYRLVLGSNTSEVHSRQFRRQFAATLRHFDAQVLSHEVGVRKPRPGFFQHCERLAGCQAAACLFIDDLPANVGGALACGWQAITYTGSGLRRQLTELGIVPSDGR
jgi:putative hydrolase of the HAD superfamily